MAIISRLAVLLGLDSGEFNKNLGIAKGQVEGFSAGAKISLAAVGTAFVTLSKQAVDFADQINDVAKANEVAVSKVLQLSQALAINGGNVEDASKLFSSFTNKIDEAVQGSDKLRKSFKDLGVSTQDLANLTEQELFEKVLKGLSSIEDPIRRNALAFDILGRSVKGVDVKSLYADYEQAKGSFEGSDEAYKRIGLAIDQMDIRWLHFKDNLAKYVVPVLEAIVSALDKIHAVNQKLDPWFDRIDRLFGFEPTKKGGATITAPTIDVSAKSDAQTTKRILQQTDEQKKAADILKKQKEYYEKEVLISQAKMGRLQKENELAFLGDTEKKRQLELYDLEQKMLLLAQEKKMTKEDIAKYGEVEKKRIEEQYKIEESQKSFEYGWKRAFKNYADDATNAAKMGEQAFVSLTNNMESALDQFVRTGKLNFGDLARSIIADLLKIQLRAQATSLFGGLGKIFGFGGGNSAGGLFGTAVSSGGLALRAEGGPLSVGKPTLVGERGPELIIPQTGGTVIPNHALGSMGNNGTQIVYNGPYIANMSAIDTQSATQFLARNKNAVWSANQSAQRSLPQSR